jgi:hypothetical protein
VVPHCYRALGLQLASNGPISGLARIGHSERADVTVELAPRGGWWRELARDPGRAWRIHPVSDESGRPVVQVRRRPSDGRFHLQFADGTEFYVDERAKRIWGSWPGHFTRADAATYLVGPVLGFAHRLRGGVSLHASAVSIDGVAVLFLGTSGAGKSTLAAAFAQRGHAVLCDDAAALTSGAGGMRVQPGSAQIRLWPDSVEALYGAADSLPLLTPNWGKRYLELAPSSGNYSAVSLPLASAYLLEPRTQDASAPRLEPVSQRDTLRLLLAHSYVGYLQDAPMRAHEFEVLAELARSLKLTRLHPSARPERIDALCDRVIDHAISGAAS